MRRVYFPQNQTRILYPQERALLEVERFDLPKRGNAGRRVQVELERRHAPAFCWEKHADPTFWRGQNFHHVGQGIDICDEEGRVDYEEPVVLTAVSAGGRLQGAVKVQPTITANDGFQLYVGDLASAPWNLKGQHLARPQAVAEVGQALMFGVARQYLGATEAVPEGRTVLLMADRCAGDFYDTLGMDLIRRGFYEWRGPRMIEFMESFAAEHVANGKRARRGGRR